MSPLDEIALLDGAMRAGELNPMEAKRRLGRALVERYYDAATAAREDEWFTQVFSRRVIPRDIPVVRMGDPNSTLLELLRQCLPGESSAELRRLIQYGGVHVDGEQKLTEAGQRHPVTSGDVIRVGKRRWFRIVFGD